MTIHVYLVWQDIGNGPHLVGVYAQKSLAMQILKDAQGSPRTKIAFIDMKPLIGAESIILKKSFA